MRHVHGLAASRSGGCQPRKPTNILRGRDWSVERPLYRIKRLNIPKYSNIAPNFALRSKQTHNLELLLHKQATADTSASSKSVEQPLEQSESAQRISCIESHIQESRRAPNTTPIQVTSPAEELCQAQSSSSAQADTFLGENQTVTLSSSRFFDEKSTSRNTSNSSNNSTTPPEQRTLKAIKQSYADQGYRLVGGPRGFNKMRSHLQFITTPTSDTPGTALLLHFDDKRYIIGNAHEGLQRASLQVGAKVFRAKDIFLTGRTEWRTTGGLLGMVLSHADAANACATSRAETARLKAERQKVREEERGQRKNKQRKKSDGDTSHVTSVSEEPTLRIHGGPNLTHTLATARSFIFRKGTPLKVLENIGTKAGNDTAHDWKPTWADNRIQVWAMPIVSSINGRLDAASKSDSPRKRSLGEFMSGQGPTSTEVSNQGLEQPQVPENQEERNQQLRNLVVSEMFGSEWRYDNLVETPLHKVKMPAALFVRNPVTKMIEAYQGPTPNGKAPVPDIKVLVRSSWPGALVDHLPPTKHSSIAMSYIIRNLKIRGKFKPEAAIALNVRRGRLWTSLTEGSSVQSTDGVTVTPDMVMEKGSEGSGVAVVELPTQDYVHDLVSRPEWEAERVMTGVGAIVWILGPGVIQDETLQAFIGTHSNLQHIVSSSDQCPNSLVLTAAATAAIRHNLIDPLRYAIPIHSNTLSPSAAKLLGEIDQISGICQPAKSGLRIELEPSFRINDEPVVPLLDTGLVVKETPKDVVRLAHAARQEIRSSKVQVETADQDLPSPDAEIICLGTGSALPSHHRNVSATLLRVPGCGSYLIDCGENTLGQLKRMYTPLQLAEILRDLKLIWISHLHADHHLGLTSVIKAWYEEVHGKDPIKRQRPSIIEQMINPAKFLEEGRRLFIVGHRNMMRWLEEYSSVEDFGYDQIVPLQAFPVDAKAIDDCSLEWNGINVGFNVSEDPRVRSAIRKATSLSNLVTCSVSHCYGSMAVALTFPTGFKFSYSGDCRPSRTFSEIGKNSTVLLHEATFDDELKGEAIAKKHSTTSEALAVGLAMQARRVILTHFSQRYQKIPSLSARGTRSLKLEDAEDVDNPMAGMDDPEQMVDRPGEYQAPVNDSSDGSAKRVPHHDAGERSQQPQPQRQNVEGIASKTNALAQIIASNINPTSRPQRNDVRIGVAFDHMRIKVGEIMHLEKFTPALLELYKETETDAKAAKEAFSDHEDEVGPSMGRGLVGTSAMDAERAEKARKGRTKAAKKENTEK